MMSSSPNAGDYVLFRGNELVLSAFGRETILGAAVLQQVTQEWGRPETVTDENGFTVAIMGPRSATLNLSFQCYGMTEEPKRQAMIERICAGLSVRELMGVVNSRLKERGK